MNKFFNYIIAAGMMVSSASCSFTDLEPTDKVGDSDIFSSVATLEQALTGAYSKMSMRTTVMATAVLSDDVIKGGQNGGAGEESYQWTYSAAVGEHNKLWANYYSVINMTNRVIDGAANVKPVDEAETKVKNNCIGSALFIRAYTYFDLLRFFSDFEKAESYGIPYAKNKVVLETLGRNSVKECFQFIHDDLDAAFSLLSQKTPENPGYASQVAVEALRARVYLYERNYQKAAQCAANVLKACPLADKDDYEDIWVDKSDKEVIFKLKRLPGEEYIGTIFFSANNSSAFEPSREIMACFAEGDYRKDLFIGEGPDRDGTWVDRVNKYKGDTENVGLVDQKLLRSSEMLLIQAEAMAHQNLSQANVLLNQLRSKRIAGWENVNYSTKEQFMEEILLERRRELCYEGHRFFDMRRFKKPIYKSLIDKTLEVDDYHRIMPIPMSEMQGNPVIANQQNPGY